MKLLLTVCAKRLKQKPCKICVENAENDSKLFSDFSCLKPPSDFVMFKVSATNQEYVQ